MSLSPFKVRHNRLDNLDPQTNSFIEIFFNSSSVRRQRLKDEVKACWRLLDKINSMLPSHARHHVHLLKEFHAKVRAHCNDLLKVYVEEVLSPTMNVVKLHNKLLLCAHFAECILRNEPSIAEHLSDAAAELWEPWNRDIREWGAIEGILLYQISRMERND